MSSPTGNIDNEKLDSEVRKEKLVKRMNTLDSIEFDGLSESKTSKVETDIDHIWNTIESSEYERYLQLLNNWFVSYRRLPRNPYELSLGKFELIGLFRRSHFREQIKAFTVKLYTMCIDHSTLDNDFIDYIENKLIKQSVA